MSDETPETKVTPVETEKKVKQIRVKTFVDPTVIKADLSWSSADMSKAYQEQASLLLDYGRLAAEASLQVDNFKLVLEQAEAKVYRQLRDDAVTSGAKMTEEALKRELQAHPQIIEIKRALNVAKQVEATLKTALEAFRHRKDMLVSKGLLDREEMRGDLTMRARDIGGAVTASLAAGNGGRVS